eukprot:NODE_2377_length_431_cov_104.819372_g2296_i0.p2 GENE.NODE_2377_length_431_cov_104.819372_g2296_i0~~NODE_2377_length_431_cov_104.819372_g2296_i0.p2  ORF type:complete len:60 (+),score=4.19 NODE_2377_length_431_cov_104.819372_g2296_i0:194-373(+)
MHMCSVWCPCVCVPSPPFSLLVFHCMCTCIHHGQTFVSVHIRMQLNAEFLQCRGAQMNN